MTEYVLGIDLGGTKILTVCTDRDLNIVAQDERETGAEDGPDAVMERMAASARAAAGGRRVLAAGIAAAGSVRTAEGVVTIAPNLGWRDVALGSRMAALLGIPVWVENDVNAGALAEHRLGAGRGSRHLIMVAPGTGIGGGLVLDGKLYAGASGGAGEVGHMQIDPAGPPCPCGRRGCLERLASGSTLDKRAREIAQAAPDGLVAKIAAREKEEPDARILDLAAEAGDEAATAALRQAGAYLGEGLANLVNIFNPEVIVIGGSVRKSPPYMQAALEIARQRPFPQHAADVRILEPELGDEAPALGAAVIAWERLSEAASS